MLKVLRHVTLHYIALHHVTVRYITLQYITLHYNTLHYVRLHYITSHCVTLRYSTLRYITLQYNTLRYIMLQYVTLHVPPRQTVSSWRRVDRSAIFIHGPLQYFLLGFAKRPGNNYPLKVLVHVFNSREIVIEMLATSDLGTFFVRDSQSQLGCYALTMKVVKGPNNPSGFGNYLIVPMEDGFTLQVCLKCI